MPWHEDERGAYCSLRQQVVLLLQKLKQISGDKELLFPDYHGVIKAMSEKTVKNVFRTPKLNYAGMDLERWCVVRVRFME